MNAQLDPIYPVSLVPPDISSYRIGNTGVDYIHQFDSGKPGPNVMISSVVHGNELCGAIAVDHMLQNDVRPMKGKLSLAFMNVDAYLSFDADNPSASRYLDEDFNRLWTKEVLKGNRDSNELRRARKVLPVLDTVDLLLDIHSMQTATTPLMMAGPLDKGCEFARKLGIPEVVVMDFGHKAGRRMREYEGFSDPESNKNALLIECGQNWEQRSADLAITASWRFLMMLGLVSEENAVAHLRTEPPFEQRIIKVSGPYTIRNSDFSFKEPYLGLEEIPSAGTVIANDGEIEVKTPYDNCVLIMPSRRQRPGDTAVRFGKYI
ncbi:MAG: succinylglutamate desuccinylase/aspartoacylase family protein [SAR202 cluster bacterium]|nr:succinylglutamate desuccinylase/aspartoacylase family protein [SAR202 cluster bacterium]